MLLEEDWRSADLRALIGRSLAAYGVGQDDRVRLEGESVSVSARQALSLSLVLHELATNALKYGALSASEGHVRILCDVLTGSSGRTLSLKWVERGGPPVTGPDKAGFGVHLITRAVEYELGGSVALDYASEGLTCEMTFPLDEEPP